MSKRKQLSPVLVPPGPHRDRAAYERGIECRGCGCRHFYVLYTRKQLGKIMRRRECRHCGKRITTYEKVA